MRVKNVLQYLESTTARLGDKVAFSAGIGEETLTFSQLSTLSRTIGSALLQRGLRGARIALLMDRRPTALAAMLGVWYAGACSIMLDGAMPQERMRGIVQRAQVSLVVADPKYIDVATALGECEVLCYDDVAASPIDEAALRALRAVQIDTDPIYMVFTSGSTGHPKGVIACHRSVIDYAEALMEALDVSESDVFGCQSPLYFDAPLKEILSTIVRGATTYLIPRRCFSFPMLLLEYIKKQQINSVCWVVSAFLQISTLGALESHPPLTLRRVVFGSEVFPRDHYDRWRAALPEATFYQLYGPTEATGMSCVWRADRTLMLGEKIPIGAALDNTDAMLIDDAGNRILPIVGEASGEGELYLRGTCVTLGYDHAPAETAAAFVQNPLQNAYPETVYKTGDLARYNGRGELIFLGRRDAQIKRMGHRVELGEIEEVALRASGVREVCCIFSQSAQELMLYYTGTAESGALLKTLGEQLPRYMMPKEAKRMTSLPYTQNGKKDRRALQALCEQASTPKNI